VPLSGTTIDYEGNEIHTKCNVLSDISRHLRQEEKLVAEMDKRSQLIQSRIGNTRLLIVDCKDIMETARNMLSNGDSFFAKPV
jgi:hypothetical protein